MPLTVTLGYVSPQPLSGRIAVGYNNSASTGGWNRLWRSTPSENGGAAMKIGDPVPLFYDSAGDFAEFYDYNVASGKSYLYFWEVSDGASVVGVSGSDSGSIVLESSWLHTVHKNYAEENYVTANGESVMKLIDFAPYRQSLRFNSSSRIIANSTRPAISGGRVRHLQVNPSILIPFGFATVGEEERITEDGEIRITEDGEIRITEPNSVRAGASQDPWRALFRSPYYVCFRDTFGSKRFGRLVSPTEQYGATFITPGLVFEQLSFDEGVE